MHNTKITLLASWRCAAAQLAGLSRTVRTIPRASTNSPAGPATAHLGVIMLQICHLWPLCGIRERQRGAVQRPRPLQDDHK